MEAQYLELIVQGTSIIWVLFLVVVDTKIPLKEIGLLLESEAKVILSPMSKEVSPILSTPWKTKQLERMRCQLSNKTTKEGLLRIQCSILRITAQSKSSNLLKKGSVCKLCYSGIVKTRSSVNLKKSRWIGNLLRCSVIRRGRIKSTWGDIMISLRNVWHSISK